MSMVCIQTFGFGTTFWPAFRTSLTPRPRHCGLPRTSTSASETSVPGTPAARAWTPSSCVELFCRTPSCRPPKRRSPDDGAAGAADSDGGAGGDCVSALATVARRNCRPSYLHCLQPCPRRRIRCRWTRLQFINIILYNTGSGYIGDTEREWKSIQATL